MLKTTEKLDKTSDRISQGRAQLAETEVGINLAAVHFSVALSLCYAMVAVDVSIASYCQEDMLQRTCLILTT